MYLNENLMLLKKYHDIDIKNVNYIDNEEYEIENTKDKKNIIKINKDGRKIYLGSKYNETENINRFLKEIKDEDAESYYIIIGFGAGEHIEELLNKIGLNNKIIVLEPDVNIINTAMKIKNFKKLITDERVKIAVYEDVHDLNEILNKHIDRSFVNTLNVKHYTNYDKIYMEKLSQAYDTVKNYHNIMVAESNTNKLFSTKIIECYFNNIPVITYSNSVNEFRNVFEGKTAVIVSSGPSLEKNIKELKCYEDKVIIIAAGRSLKALLDNGIKPHFVCALDPGEVMFTLMENVLEEDIPLVCSEQLNYNLLSSYKGNKIVSAVDIKRTIEKVTGRKFEKLPVGGSVAHLCTSFAVYSGVKNVIFIGQDLAYTNMKQHSSGCSNEELLKFSVGISKDGAWVDGNCEDKVYTSEFFEVFRKWFEAFIKHNPQAKFINSTEGGAKIEGTIIKPLKEALNNYCKEDEFILSTIKDIINKPININLKNTIKALENLKNTLIKIKDESSKAIKFSKQMGEYYSGNHNIKIRNILQKLDNIDKYIEKDEELRGLVNICVYEKLEEVTLNPIYREKIGETDTEKGIRLAKKDEKLYSIYIEGADKILPFVEDAILKIKDMQ